MPNYKTGRGWIWVGVVVDVGFSSILTKNDDLWNHQQCYWFLYVETCNFGETNPQYRVLEIACQPRHVLMTLAGFALVWREHKCMWLAKQKMFSIQNQSLFFFNQPFCIIFSVTYFHIRPSTHFIHFLQKIGRRDYHLFGAMHIMLKGLRSVDVGIIYPILGKVLFQISFKNHENILAHNTALVISGNSGLPRLNSSQKSSDIPLLTQSPIWVNPMGPITLSFGKKCYSVTTPGDNLQINSTKRAFIDACRPVFMSTKLVLSRVHVPPATQWSAWCGAARTLVDM